MYPISKTNFMKSNLLHFSYDMPHSNPLREEKIQQSNKIKFNRRTSRRNLFILLIMYFISICFLIF